MIGAKLHKVSDEPASTLEFSTPGVVSKENPPHQLGGALSRSKQVASVKYRGPRGIETVQTLV